MSHGRWGGVIGPYTSVKTHMLSILGSMCVGGSTALNMYCMRSGPPTHTLGQCPNSRDFPSVAGPRRECGPKGQKANALSGLSHLFLLLLRSAMGKPRPRKRMQGCPYLFTKCGRDGGWGRQPGPCPLIVVRFTKKFLHKRMGLVKLQYI